MTFELKTFDYKSCYRNTIILPPCRIQELTKDMPLSKNKALEGHVGPLFGFKVISEIWCGSNRGYVFDENGEMKLMLVFD